MELYLQYGNDMRPTCLGLLSMWGEASVILSPIDLEGEKLIQVAHELSARGANVLLDAQWYDPHADRHALLTHPWWLRNFSTSSFDAEIREAFVQELVNVNYQLGAERIIVPGRICKVVDDEWLDTQAELTMTTASIAPDKKRLATICVSNEVMAFEEQIEEIVSSAKAWDVQGYYVLAESPSGYLVRDPIWMTNLLLLCAGLGLHNRQVIVGYCSHQMLALSVARVAAIASGMTLTVRNFRIGHFNAPKPPGGRQPIMAL